MTAKLPPAVAAKVKDGHTLEDDPTHGLSSVRRWTCTTCGDSVLKSGSVIYGGVTDRTCEESRIFWREGLL